jgi:hypothetical protein
VKLERNKLFARMQQSFVITAIAISGCSLALVTIISFYAIRSSLKPLSGRDSYVYAGQESVERKLYEDEDGSASEASQSAFQRYASRIRILVVFLTLGTAVLAITAALLSATQSGSVSPIPKYVFAVAWVCS